MRHHIMVKGLNSASLAKAFEETAVEKMKHAEKIAEATGTKVKIEFVAVQSQLDRSYS